MVRQGFSISALLTLVVALALADVGHAQLLRRNRGNSDNTVIATPETQAPVPAQNVTKPSGATATSTPAETTFVRTGRFLRRRGYWETTPVAATTQGPARESMYPPDATMRQVPVYLSVRVPATAELLFGDSKTSQIGAMRYFVSPPINADRTYVYEITAKWQEDGKPRTEIRKIDVRAGQNLMVDLTLPVQERAR